MEVVLPSHVYDNTLPEFLFRLGEANGQPEITVDFKAVSFLTTGAIVGLITKVHSWLAAGSRVLFRNHGTCQASQYLQRFNFFRQCNITITEGFTRRNPSGRFVELERVGLRGARSVEDCSTAAARCISPDVADEIDSDISGPFDCVQYAISELLNNVSQHSRGYGFVAVQYMPYSDLTRLAVGDCGIGVLKSFEDSGSPHWHATMSDLQALKKAVQPKVSSKNHMKPPWGDAPNAGVGLTLLKGVSQIAGGTFTIASGNAIHRGSGDFTCSHADRGFQGTLCELTFPRKRVTNFFNVLGVAKRNAGLLSSNAYGGMFS